MLWVNKGFVKIVVVLCPDELFERSSDFLSDQLLFFTINTNFIKIEGSFFYQCTLFQMSVVFLRWGGFFHFRRSLFRLLDFLKIASTFKDFAFAQLSFLITIYTFYLSWLHFQKIKIDRTFSFFTIMTKLFNFRPWSRKNQEKLMVTRSLFNIKIKTP